MDAVVKFLPAAEGWADNYEVTIGDQALYASSLEEVRSILGETISGCATDACECGCTTDGFSEAEVLDGLLLTWQLGLPQPPCYRGLD